MARFEIRTASGTSAVETAEDLRRLARLGQLRGEDPVRVDGGPWRRADSLGELKGSFNLNVWGAWEDDEDEPTPQGAALPSSAPPAAPPKVEPPRVEAPKVDPPKVDPPKVDPPKVTAPRVEAPKVEPPKVEPPRVVDLPAAAIQPLPEPPRSSRGLVIAFPGERGRRGAEAARAEPVEPEPPLLLPRGLERAQPVTPSRLPLRWFVYAAMVGGTVLVTALTVGYVRSMARWTAPDPAALTRADDLAGEPSGGGASGPPVVRRPEARVGAADSEDLEALTRDLRGQLSLQSVDPDADGETLADAMFIDLRRLISVRDTHVQVLRMTETRRPLPEVVEVRVWVNTQGDVVRELAAVGLVVGKYLYQLSLDALVVEAILVSEDGGTRKRVMRGEAAEALFQGQMPLAEFLLDAPPEPAPGEPAPSP